MSEMILNEANFNAEVLQSSVPVLVDFWAPWCGPCQMMGPIIEELAQEYDSGKVKIAKVNVDENGNLAQQYGVLSIPTFILFQGGQQVDSVIGGVQKERLKELIARHSV
jgi:thioredoxin 1